MTLLRGDPQGAQKTFKSPFKRTGDPTLNPCRTGRPRPRPLLDYFSDRNGCDKEDATDTCECTGEEDLEWSKTRIGVSNSPLP